MRRQQAGFTLIELVVVITLIGILAAVALPRFIDVQRDARIAVLDGVESSMRGAAALVYAKALIAGVETESSANVSVNGANVAVIYGYPDDTAINNLLDLQGGTFDVSTAGTVAVRQDCSITYSDADATNPYGISRTLSGC